MLVPRTLQDVTRTELSDGNILQVFEVVNNSQTIRFWLQKGLEILLLLLNNETYLVRIRHTWDEIAAKKCSRRTLWLIQPKSYWKNESFE